jgi:hypothetical protein
MICSLGEGVLAENEKVEILTTLAFLRPTLGGDRASHHGTAHSKRRRFILEGKPKTALGVLSVARERAIG